MLAQALGTILAAHENVSLCLGSDGGADISNISKNFSPLLSYQEILALNRGVKERVISQVTTL